ncbi:MAG: hypothetical protein JST86_13325 [Bacteroidetes bacterium]|nr:hypothetical protein [Bacteroidota bacterium]
MRHIFSFVLIGLLCSCGGAKYATITKDDERMGKESNSEVFVVTSDGVKHSGTKFKFPPDHFATSDYIAIDGVRYSRKHLPDIIAYQNETGYHQYIPIIKRDALRIRNGKINLFTYLHEETTFSGGISSVTGFRRYLIEKEKNNLQLISYEVLETAFADNVAVLQKFHELYPDKAKANKSLTKNAHLDKQEYAVMKNIELLIDMYNGR